MPATSPYPQGTFSFSGGIPEDAVLSFRVTQNHGITPAIFKVRMNMLPEVPDKNGDVTIKYGSFKRTFKNCTIDLIDRPDGAQLVWDVTILDRRWKWQFPTIDGAYNQRWKNGTELRDETKKTPSQLVALCLLAMGEKNYDIAPLKDFDQLDWPETTWDNANAANAAQEICERYGCRLLCVFDRAIVVKVGDGQGFDSSLDHLILEDSETFDPPEKPGKIVLRCGPTSVQGDLPLYAVAVDTDGTIRPMHKVSYAPGSPTFLQGQPVDFTNGSYVDKAIGFWNALGQDFHGLPAPYLRHLARENIFRLFRIHPPAQFYSLNEAWGDSKNTKPDLESFPDVSQDSAHSWLWRIALQNEQNDRVDRFADPLNTKFDEYNKEVASSAMPAWVYGYYWSSQSYGNAPRDDQDSQGNVTKLGVLKLDPSVVFSPQKLNASIEPGEDAPTTVSYKVLDSGFYLGGFSIDPQWGVVKFSEPVFQNLPPKQSGVTAKYANGAPLPNGVTRFPPTLWLRTRFLLRDPDTRGWVRAERVRVLDQNNPTTRYVTRDDLVLKLTYRYKGPPNITTYPARFTSLSMIENWDVISKAADAYLDEIEKEYQTVDPHSVTYGEFVPYKIDGAIREVTWYVGEDGYARTRVCRNTDYLVWHQDYAERRLAERIKNRLDDAASRDISNDQLVAMRAAVERPLVF